MPKKEKPIWETKAKEMRLLLNKAIAESLITEDQLPSLLADAWAWNEIWEEDYKKLSEITQDYETVLAVHHQKEFGNVEPDDTERVRSNLLKMWEDSGSKAAKLLLQGESFRKSSKGRQLANIRHDKPGGSREKQNKIRNIWASGKYSSRDRCAEEEHSALGMSFSAARKALRNTPDP